MESKKSIRIFLVGLALVGIYINIKTGISTAYNSYGGGGLKGFFVDRVNEILVGKSYSVDIFFNPVGYILMAVGLLQMSKKLKKSKLMLIAVAVAMVLSIVQAVLPLSISNGVVLIKLVIGVYIVEGILLLLVMTTFVGEIKSKVDAYYNMEVGKDLVFATELFFFAYFMMIIVIFATAIGIFFANILMVLDYVAMIYSILYFVYKVNKYNVQLNFFE